VIEEQDLVYKEPVVVATPPARTAAPAMAGAVEDEQFSDTKSFDSVHLFRFSAATLNSHRIHYDVAYARDVEGYAGLVVHGPLLALLMLSTAGKALGPDKSLESFSFRGVAPSFAGEQLEVHGKLDDSRVRIWIACDGALRAEAEMSVVN
jgi:3-methylfumaryl-CoA hydratase